MKLCLAIAFQNELPWLTRHMPILRKVDVDGIVMLDGGSTDGSTEYATVEVKASVFHRPFDWNFSAHMNALIQHCERLGYDALLRLDPDECMFAKQINEVRGLLETYKVLRFPRYNLERDEWHYCPALYPDWQTRAWHLNNGVFYSGMVHETLEESLFELGWIESASENNEPRDILRVPHLHIYHYGGIENNARTELKFLNYDRRMKGLAPINELPEGHSIHRPSHFTIPFTLPQPYEEI